MTTTLPPQPVGCLLRDWRRLRRLSQLDLSVEAAISTRHLSFIETGRSHPSRDMVLHLAEQLEVPLRERNVLLMAAGFAPEFPERNLDDAALQSARKAMDLLLRGHEPYPAIAIDRHWDLVASNGAVPPLLAGDDTSWLASHHVKPQEPSRNWYPTTFPGAGFWAFWQRSRSALISIRTRFNRSLEVRRP